MMDTLLEGLPFAAAYLDDLVIFSKDFASHMSHIETVLFRLQNADLAVKASKCQWVKEKGPLMAKRFEPECPNGNIKPNYFF